MSINQSAKEPVAATPQGTPRDVSESGTPTDLVAKSTSDATKGGEFDVTQQSRRQATEPPSATPPDAPHLRSRPQHAGSPAQRVNAQSVPNGGLVPPTPTVQPSKGTGSIGVTRPPFKGMK